MVTRIGFVGVGRMGLPMCANLVAAGHTVTAGDARPELEPAVVRCGARWGGTLAEVAAGADLLITMLPGSAEVREVVAGSGVLGALPATAVWVDMTSSSPAAGRELAAAAQARGVAVLDAPVGGGPAAARAGTLQVFVGGDAAVLNRCRPVLEALADPQRIIHVGGQGAGYTVKLLVNLLWFGQAVATGEALLVARRAGIDLDVLRQALTASAAATAFIRDDLGALLDGDYLTSFGLDRCCEELAAVADLAGELGVPAQLTQVVEQTYQRALRHFGPVDGELMAVALLEEEAGLRLRDDPARRLPPK
jgi:3-hydroxyisobutyrate dehydrogenase